MNIEPMFKMRRTSYFIKCFVSFIGAGTLAVSVSAQTDMTARERVLDYITSTSSSAAHTPAAAQPFITDSPAEAPIDAIDIPPEDVNMALADTVLPIYDVDTPIEDFNSDIISTAPSTPVIDIPAPAPPVPPSRDTENFSDNVLSDKEREDSIVRDLSQVERLSGGGKPKSFAFFTTAPDYLAQRGDATGPRLTLRYDVTRKNAKTAAMGASSVVDIIIGSDYAAISKTADELIIYDFKEKRLLNLSKSSNSFTNTSLYAASYRAFETVGKMTNGGRTRALPLGPDVTLDAFYLESALGYAAGPTPPSLTVTQDAERITADFVSETSISDRVFSASLNGPKLEDYRQAYSFIGLLYHSEPVHPAILAELKDVRAAPNAMTFHSFGPKIPDGEIISWTLKSKMSETAEFPLPNNATSTTEGESVSPLGFVMSEAVAGRALGGQVEPSSALTVINQQLDLGDTLSAWVSAQSLKDMVGGCERLAGLCRAISKARSQADATPELSSLIAALAQTERASTRIEGLKALEPMTTAGDAPSLVLRRAGLALAKTSTAQREAAGLSSLDPASLLSQAIARNPYDLLAYQGLAQLMAARGDFIQSWNINDALRAFEGTSETLRAPIDRAEAQLESAAPGFFPPVDP